MPYYLSDELASKPYWDNLLLIRLYFTAGSNQTSRLDIKIDKYIWLLFFFLFQSLKACVNTVWHSNYTLSNYDTFIHTHIEYYRSIIDYSNMTSIFRFVNKRASYPFGIISLAHAPVNLTDFSIGNINCVRHFPQTYIVNINYRLPIKVYYSICTLRHIRIKINHGCQNVLGVLTWIGGY
jgi:hypothetical protein